MASFLKVFATLFLLINLITAYTPAPSAPPLSLIKEDVHQSAQKNDDNFKEIVILIVTLGTSGTLLIWVIILDKSDLDKIEEYNREMSSEYQSGALPEEGGKVNIIKPRKEEENMEIVKAA
jgi:hypothetical protein